MFVHALTANNFRNLEQVTLQPHPRFNVLHGDNGQGKTNLLEAIYLIATLRSFRTNRIEELIKFGSDAAHVRACVEHRLVQRQLAVGLALRPTRKQAFVDGKTARGSEYFGGVNVVLFAPEDLRLPKGPPACRRRFLDRAIWNTFPSYLEEVKTYERLLRNRNAVLRGHAGRSTNDDGTSGGAAKAEEPGESLAWPAGGLAAAEGASYGATLLSEAELLDIYDRQLAAAGAVLMQRRRSYLQELQPQMAATFAQVSRSGLLVELRYAPAIASQKRQAALSETEGRTLPGQQLEELLAEQLRRDRRRDLLRGYTHSGPHADDVEVFLDARSADTHASQGQIRALVLSLKITEIQHLFRVLGDAPVLLLDDVSSELDPQRNAYLFEFLRTMPCQVFITTTSPAHVQLGEDRKDMHIRGGAICA